MFLGSTQTLVFDDYTYMILHVCAQDKESVLELSFRLLFNVAELQK